jgi:hypothetical protein
MNTEKDEQKIPENAAFLTFNGYILKMIQQHA